MMSNLWIEPPKRFVYLNKPTYRYFNKSKFYIYRSMATTVLRNN